MIGHRFFDEAVKFPCRRVGFDLTVPNLGVEIGEPLAELRKFHRRKTLDEEFKLLDCAHGHPQFTTLNNCTPVPSRRLTLS